MEALIEPGTKLFYNVSMTEDVVYEGIVMPPRQIPITAEVANMLDDPSNAAVFHMGGVQQLFLGAGQTIFVRIEAAFLDKGNKPSIYYLNAEGGLELAGINGTKHGVTVSRGGSILSEQADVPAPGFKTYTMGLLIDHMSIYAIGTVASGGTSADYTPITTGGDDSSYGCFIELLTTDLK